MRGTPSHSRGDAIPLPERVVAKRALETTEAMSQTRGIATPTWTTFDIDAALANSGEALPPFGSSNSLIKRPKEWLTLQADRAQAARLALNERRSWAGPGITEDGAPRASPPLRKTRRLSSANFPAPLLPLPDASVPPIRRASLLLASADIKSGSDNQKDIPAEHQQQSRHTLHPSQEESYRYATCILNGLNDLEKSLMRVSKDLRYVCVNIRTDSGSRICPDDVHSNDDDDITAMEGATEGGTNQQSRKAGVDKNGFNDQRSNKNKVNKVTSFHDFVYALSKRVLADVFVLNKIFRRRTTPILNPVLDAFRQCGAIVPDKSNGLQGLSEVANRMFRQPEQTVPDAASSPPSKTAPDLSTTTPKSSIRSGSPNSPMHVRLLEACKNGIDRTLYPKFFNDNDINLTDYDLAGWFVSQEETIEFWNRDQMTSAPPPSTSRTSPAQPLSFAVDLAAINEPFGNTVSSVDSQVPLPLPQFRLSRPMTSPIAEKQPAPPVNPPLQSEPSSPGPLKSKKLPDKTPFSTHSNHFPHRPDPWLGSPPVPRKRQPVTVIHDTSDEEEIRPGLAAPSHYYKSPRITPTNAREKPRAERSPPSPYRRPAYKNMPRPTRPLGPPTPKPSRMHSSQQRLHIPCSAGGSHSLSFGSLHDPRRGNTPRSERILPNDTRSMRNRDTFHRDRGRKRNWEHVHHNDFARSPRRRSISPAGRGGYISRGRGLRGLRSGEPRRRDFTNPRVRNDEVPAFRYRSQMVSNDRFKGRHSYSPSPPRSPCFYKNTQRHSSVSSMPFLPIPRLPPSRRDDISNSSKSSPRRDTPIVELD